MDNFGLYSQYYDLLYREKDTRGECEYVSNYLLKFGVQQGRWLELGAGSGRHGQFFIKHGIDWQGVELSASMADLGRTKGLAITVQDIRQFDLGKEVFDAVLGLFHVVSYLVNNEDVIACFDRVFAHLRPGGLFLFDVWYTPAVVSQQPSVREKMVEDDKIKVRRKATPTMDWSSNLVNVHYDIEVSDSSNDGKHLIAEDHLMRHFGIPELRLFAQVAGLEFLHAEEWMTCKTPGPDTWGVCCILKKPQ